MMVKELPNRENLEQPFCNSISWIECRTKMKSESIHTDKAEEILTMKREVEHWA